MIFNLQHLKCESATFDPKIKPQGLQALLHQPFGKEEKQLFLDFYSHFEKPCFPFEK